MRPLPLLVAISLCGCTGFKTGDDTASDTGAPDDSGAPTDTGTGTSGCVNQVVGLFPAQGDTDVFFRTAVRATLAADEPEAAIHVTDAGGVEVAGVTAVTGAVVSWFGDPLAPDGAYTATLDWSCGPLSWGFETNSVGTPIVADPVGVVYELALADAQWVQPAGVGPLLAAQLGDGSILVSPVALDAETVTLRFAAGEAGVQDLCVPTVDNAGAWDDPAFTSTMPTVPFHFADMQMDVEDAALSGAFAADVSAIDGVAIAGVLDMRSIPAALETGTYDVCELVATFGVSCVPCPDGETYCLETYIDGIDGPSVIGTVVPRTDADIAADPTCQ